jgi:hypothetical protein
MLAILLAGAAVVPTDAVDCVKSVPSFMREYARDLLAGSRAALARRYSSKGAYSLGFQPKSYDSLAQIAQRYAGTKWRKPDDFAWQDLSFEQLGSDTCLVAGSFRWTASGSTGTLAYTAVLRREGQDLRIILEHENVLPQAATK